MDIAIAKLWTKPHGFGMMIPDWYQSLTLEECLRKDWPAICGILWGPVHGPIFCYHHCQHLRKPRRDCGDNFTNWSHGDGIPFSFSVSLMALMAGGLTKGFSSRFSIAMLHYRRGKHFQLSALMIGMPDITRLIGDHY